MDDFTHVRFVCGIDMVPYFQPYPDRVKWLQDWWLRARFLNDEQLIAAHYRTLAELCRSLIASRFDEFTVNRVGFNFYRPANTEGWFFMFGITAIWSANTWRRRHRPAIWTRDAIMDTLDDHARDRPVNEFLRAEFPFVLFEVNAKVRPATSRVLCTEGAAYLPADMFKRG